MDENFIMSEKAQGKIPPGTVLSDSNKKNWIIGSFIEIDRSAAECYEAAEYNKGETPEHYPGLIKVKPHGDKTLSSEINFFKHHAKPEDIDRWTALKDVHYEYLGLPYYLGSGQNITVADINVDILVLTRYVSNLETVLNKHNNLLPKPTVLKIAYHILGVLEYLHNRNIVHGHIQAYNIRMDRHDKHVVYLLPQFHVADESDHNAKTFWSGYQHLTESPIVSVIATTKRGDMESLLYNLIDWSGGILPWKNASPDKVKDMKNKAFEDPEQFLKEAFPCCKCKNPSECMAARKCETSGEPVAASECLHAIRDLMGQLVSMDETYDCSPDYKTIEKILKKRLLNMYHIPTSTLEFSVPTLIGDEDHDGRSSRAERKKIASYVPGLAIAASTLATIIAENCSSFDEVHTLDSKSCGVIDVLLQMNVTKRENVIRPAVRMAWEQDTQDLRTMVLKLWRSKGIQSGSYESWKRKKGMEKKNKRNTIGASMGKEKKTAVRNRSEPIVSKSTNVATTQCRHPLGLKRQQDQQRKRCNESSIMRRHINSIPFKRLKFGNFASGSESDEDDREDARSASASESDEDDREDARSASASESDNVQFSISSVSSNRRSIEYDIDPCSLSTPRMFEQPLDKKLRVATQKLVLGMNEAADESVELFSEESTPETTEVADRTAESILEKTIPETAKEADGTDEPVLKEEVVPETTKVADRISEQAIESVTLVFVDRESWSSTYKRVESWLRLREKLLKALEPVSSEPHLMSIQVQDLWVLRDEYGMQELVNRLGHLTNVLTGLSPDSDDAQKLNRIHRQWLTQLAWLEERIQKLGDKHLNYLFDVLQNSEVLAWLVKEFDGMPEKLTISTDPMKLQHQLEHYRAVCQRIKNKEDQVKMLLDEGRSLLARSQNIENGPAQQLFLDVVKFQWNCLKKDSINCNEKLKICMAYSKKYYQAQYLFSRWLSEVEHKSACLKPSSLKDIEKVLQELTSLSNAVHEKSGDIEQCINLGHTFIGACDEDQDDVLKKELISINDRWDKLHSNLLERRETLKETGKRFENISKNLLELKDKIQLRHNELVSFYASEGVAKNLKIHHHVTELQSKIVIAREQVIDLVSKAGHQGIDATYLMDEINHAAASIDSLKIKLVDICKKILERQLISIAKELQEMKKDECDNPIDRLNEQVSEVKVLLSKINTLSGDINSMVTSIESVLGSVTDAAEHAAA